MTRIRTRVVLPFFVILSGVVLYLSLNISLGSDVEEVKVSFSPIPTQESKSVKVTSAVVESVLKTTDNQTSIQRLKREEAVYLQAELAGGLNNQRICLANAIALAYLLDLKLLKPTGLGPFSEVTGSKQLEQKSVDINEYFDLSLLDLSVTNTGLIKMLPSLPHGTKKIKAHFKSGSHLPHELVSQISDLVLSKKANYLKLKCQFSVDWLSSPQAIQHVATEVMNKIRPAKKIKEVAEGIIQKLPDQYIALHVRAEPDWVVLRAAAFERISANFDKDSVTEGEITAALLSAKSILVPPFHNTTIYIAGGTPCDDYLLYSVATKLSLLPNVFCGTRKKTTGIELTRLSKGKANNLQMRRGDMSYIKGYVDQLIAERSSIFIGRKESSWAAMVAYVRRMQMGFLQPSTLYLPDYERRIKKREGSGDLDIKCFNFKCVPEETPFNVKNSYFAVDMMLEVVGTESARFEDVFKCLSQTSLKVWPGIMDNSNCPVRQFLSWFDSRILPFPIHVTIQKTSHDADTGWVHSWIPSFVHSQLNITSFLDSVLPPPRGIWIYVGSLKFLHTLSVLPTEAFVECQKCVEDIRKLRIHGVYAHMISPRT